MRNTLTFKQTGQAWLDTLHTVIQRNGRPLSARTQIIYARNFRRIVDRLGDEALPVANKTLKDYVSWMRRGGYGSSQINGDLVVIKLVCDHLCDEKSGDVLYPLTINRKYVAAPAVIAEEQEAPVASREDIERALAVPEIRGIIAIASGAGLRISEILALRVGDDGVGDAWDAEASVIHIRRTLKTPSAKRDVYLCGELNGWLRELMKDAAPGALMFTESLSKLYKVLEARSLPPWHAYRRAYATHADEAMLNDQVLKRLMGHKRVGVTARYIKSQDDFIKSEVERIGIGFTLPQIAATQEAIPV